LAYKNRCEIDKFNRSQHVQIAGRSTVDKLADHSARGITNTFSLSNINFEIQEMQNTYMILDAHLASWNLSWIFNILSRKENL